MPIYYQDGPLTIHHGDALALPFDDNTVDLVVTSPPYFGLRSYRDGGEHYDGQIGAEATPAEFVDALVAATREMMRVLKPSGSIWINLGDKYAGSGGGGGGSSDGRTGRASRPPRRNVGIPTKSLIGIPWRYAIRCIDDLGLILRAEVVWSKPNGLPESVKDRVRRSHETWFHFTLGQRYYSAVDEVREEHTCDRDRGPGPRTKGGTGRGDTETPTTTQRNPLGKLPGSVWTIATEPLRVPKELGIDHFAAFPTEWPRRIIQGWSPRGVCVECGAGRRPVSERTPMQFKPSARNEARKAEQGTTFIGNNAGGTMLAPAQTVITGEECACGEPTAPTTPGVVLDPFGGTGTTALVARALGREAHSVDLSLDYCRLAQWRVTDPKQRAKIEKKVRERSVSPATPRII